MEKARLLIIPLTAILIMFLLAGCGNSNTSKDSAQAKQENQQETKQNNENRELSIMTWEGYVTDSLIDAFEKETGIKVNVTYISDNNEIIAKLRATGGEGYDLIQPSIDNIKSAQTQFKIYQPIDISKVKVMDNFEPSLLKAVQAESTVDGKLYALPYVWGTSGIVVNTKYVNKKDLSYQDIYDDQWAGKVTTRYAFPTFVGAAYGLGVDLFGDEIWNNPDKYNEAMDKTLDYLIKEKKNIKTYWTTRQGHIDLMQNEETVISQGWDGTGWLLNKQNPDIRFIAPKEGALGWIDTYAISAGAKNIAEAYDWINFTMNAQWGGQISSEGGFLSAAKGFMDYLPKEQSQMVKESFPPETIANIKWYPSQNEWNVKKNSEVVEKLKAAK
ncbi:spermidine/putrescine transport system substrate-binding protein [Desulfotomaculum arcticum]|uniref:Spermidine/putrescine transport system substrate-binding protein n=1 Tax=Desulfotruncus arcticus DSM 17038 TaxID=1121424 RepID=A0A1I2VXS1_9FIRM|nr:extracellular solute-binding protein [Desulfotruncus arcticus]SFG93189.1 spermidine/putrescine transport system substrate-binding protein [Desulfotomaculum arcticum] [Desulfotruncus arcticus DSM 17038]